MSGRGYVQPQAGLEAVTVAGQRVAPVGVGGPEHCSSKPLPLGLRSRGNVSRSVLRGAALPARTAGHREARGPPGPGRQGSELQQQMEAGGQCHCCPDFFSFWKLKLVRLFSFLCF